MKKIIKPLMATIITGLLALTSPAQAQEQKEESVKEEQTSSVLFNARSDLLNKYMLRGYTLSEDPVIQPTLSTTSGDFSLIGFGNIDTRKNKLNEADITIDYTRALAKDLTLSTGYTLLTFPNTQNKKTQEVYAGVILDKSLKPSLKVSHDFDEGKGTSIELSGTKSFNLGESVVSLTGVLGYNDHYFRENSGLSNLEIKLSAPTALGKNATLTPMLNYSKSLNNSDFQDELYGGVSLNFSF